MFVLAAAAAAGGALLFTRHHAPQQGTALNSSQSARTSSPAQASSAPGQGSSAPVLSPSGTSPSPSGVTIGTGVSQDPNASSVAGFLGQYFAAINAHDYQSYLSLLSPQLQQATTQAQFDKGYRSTADSDERLVGLSTASDGDLTAEVTFTSHQNPADSPDKSIMHQLGHIPVPGPGWLGYVIDPAPSGYQATYQVVLVT